jgi:ABC-2 type transport system permease protein
MADRNRRLAALAVTLALVALNLLALNYLIAGWSTARLDLTSEGLYSITPATRRLITALDEELTIYGYFSSRTHPKLAPLVPEITDLLAEYRAVSRGRIHVEIVDPSADSAVEQEAADRYGVQSTPFRLASKYESAIVNAYFAIVIKYGDEYVRYGFDDLIEVEAPPDGDLEVRLRNLEYDLTRAIKKVVYGFRGSGELFERLEQPAKLTLIWTPATLPEIFSGVPEAVRKAAEELQQAAGDKFRVEEIDPTGNEAIAEDLYRTYGAQPMSLGLFGGDSFYLDGVLQVGEVAERLVLTSEALTAAAVREAIENALKRHTPGFLKTVGIVTPDPPDIPPEIRMQMQLPPQPPPEFEELKAVLRQEYQVSDVDLDRDDGVPSDVDILLVVKPRDLSEKHVYNLDQYLMRGGRVVLCAGSYDVQFGQGLSLSPIETGLDGWLAHHGITIGDTLVLDDRNQALPIPEIRQTPFGAMRTWTLAPYPYLVQVREDGFLHREITSTLNAVGIYWGSPLTVAEPAKKDNDTPAPDVIPLLRSSQSSWTDTDLSRVGFVDYTVPESGTEPQLLAAALSGRFASYFEAGKHEPEAAEGAAVADDKSKLALRQSPETRLVVVGNAEFLSDFVARALAQVDGGFFLENLRFVQNVIDWVALDNDMLSIRARGMVSRRLERIGRPTEVAVEAASYAVPIVLLFGIGAWLHLRRKQAVALTASSRAGATTAPSPGEV